MGYYHHDSLNCTKEYYILWSKKYFETRMQWERKEAEVVSFPTSERKWWWKGKIVVISKYLPGCKKWFACLGWYGGHKTPNTQISQNLHLIRNSGSGNCLWLWATFKGWVFKLLGWNLKEHDNSLWLRNASVLSFCCFFHLFCIPSALLELPFSPKMQYRGGKRKKTNWPIAYFLTFRGFETTFFSPRNVFKVGGQRTLSELKDLEHPTNYTPSFGMYVRVFESLI